MTKKRKKRKVVVASEQSDVRIRLTDQLSTIGWRNGKMSKFQINTKKIVDYKAQRNHTNIDFFISLFQTLTDITVFL